MMVKEKLGIQNGITDISTGGEAMNKVKEPIFYAKASVDTMMRKYKAADLPPKGHFHYHQGVFLSGVYKTYQACGEKKYFQYIKDWVDASIDKDGTPVDFNKGHLDDLQPGILMYALLDETGDVKYKKALDLLVTALKDMPRNEIGGFIIRSLFCVLFH